MDEHELERARHARYVEALAKYDQYANAFTVDFGADYKEVERRYLRAAVCAGIFPDVGYLLYALGTTPGTRSILEFGSGLSTVVLALAATKDAVPLVTLESLPKWADLVRGEVRSYGLNSTLYCEEACRTYTPMVPVDFLWVDGQITPSDDETGGRLRACEQYEQYLGEATIAFDDAQWMADRVAALMIQFGRSPASFCWYNPVGRDDRHIFISFSDSPLGERHRAVVQRCAARIAEGGRR